MNRSFYEGKTAYVTGASEGIGRSVAEDLVGLGAHVVLLSRDEEKLKRAVALAERKRVSPGQRVLWKSLDVTDTAAVRSCLDALVEECGVPDFLFNCAGFAHPGYFEFQSVDTFRQMMDVNYFGAVNTTKALIPYFLKAKTGHVVNVSSIGGFLGLFGYTGYCASKYAVIGFSEALRHEFKPFGIKVSVLCPPNTRTPGFERENLLKPAEVLKVEEKIKPVDPAEVSCALLKTLPKNKFMIIPTFDGTIAYYLSRYLPSLIHHFIKRPMSVT